MRAGPHPLFFFAAAVAAVASCTVVSIEGESSSGAPGGADAATDSGGPGDRDGPVGDGPVDPDAAADACVATGTLAIDTTFAAKPIPVAQILVAPAPGGRYAVVGRSSCADGGGMGTELRFLDANGDPSPAQPPCMAEGLEIVGSISARPSGGFEIGASVGNGIYDAVVRTVGPSGLVQGTRTRNGNFHQLAVAVGTSTLWAGHRDSPVPDGTGFLGIAGAAITELPGERVVAAAARGSNVFAMVMTLASPADPSVTLRKYVVAGAVSEDLPARSQPVSLAPPASAITFIGNASVLVDATSVIAAVPTPGAITIYSYTEAAGWSPKGSVAALVQPPTLLRSCDGSLLLAYVSSAGGHRLARFVEGSPTPASEITLASNASTRAMIRDSRGRVVVFQALPAGQGGVLRVVP